MRLLTDNVLLVEEGDTNISIAKWIEENTYSKPLALDPEGWSNSDSWLFQLRPGNLIVFTSEVLSKNGIFRFNVYRKNVHMLTESQQEVVPDNGESEEQEPAKKYNIYFTEAELDALGEGDYTQ